MRYSYPCCVLQAGTKDSVTAISLIYCLNCYHFSWPSCYFCHYTVTYLQSLILESGFCDSGESWETKLFYRQEAGRGLGPGGGWGSVPGRPHRVLLHSIFVQHADGAAVYAAHPLGAGGAAKIDDILVLLEKLFKKKLWDIKQ